MPEILKPEDLTPKHSSMITDRGIQSAVSSIQVRSDRQEDIDKLIRSFVDPGVLQKIDNNNNQIIYGRRGTGKTHVLRAFEATKKGSPNIQVLYLDLRFL